MVRTKKTRKSETVTVGCALLPAYKGSRKKVRRPICMTFGFKDYTMIRKHTEGMSKELIMGHKDETFRMQVSWNSTLRDLKAAFVEKFKLCEGEYFRVQYLDGDGDWLVIFRDDDILDCLYCADLLDNNQVRIKTRPYKP